ncbi:MAG TPA: hypothetical protein VJU84_08565 [Pyrinomonadaceae bacterium]|nr:hypothetical protein [Pyrinomonadaceae bacterium]
MRSDRFVLINLEGGESFVFQFFPREIETHGRANWEPQDVTIGTRPIFYANSDGHRISVQEVYLDRTDSNESIAPDIKALNAMRAEVQALGRPPALLAAWGDESYRCVLEDVSVRRTMFAPGGEPLRASVSMQLLELQDEREAVDVVVTDPPEDSGSGIGDF